MLYLTRKIGDTIIINDDIIFEIIELKGNSVKIGISSPEKVSILRGEIYDKIKSENQAARHTKDSLIATLLKSEHEH